MTIFRASILLLASCFAVVLQAIAQDITGTGKTSQVIQNLRKQVRLNGSCKINLCFALDGNTSSEEFGVQRRIVSLVSRVVTVDDSARLSAVRYSASNIPISPLTDDADKFLKSVNDARRSDTKKTFIGGGILYCADQIRAFPDDSNWLLLLGDGRNTLGIDPVERADTFRELGGDILAIGIGNADVGVLRRIVDGDKDKVLLFDVEEDDRKSIIDLVVNVVAGVCGIKKTLLETTSE